MIVSHKHKFIFIKTKKTAGTSIEIALTQVCDDGDILTAMNPEDEALRKEMTGRSAQNDTVPTGFYGLKDWLRLIFKGKRLKYYNHMTATELKSQLDPKVWNSYYKFCFEREPLKKAISHYKWRSKKVSYDSFSQYLDSSDVGMIKGSKYYRNSNSELQVDKVYKMEEMQAAFEELAQQLNLPELKMPAINAKRSESRPELAPDKIQAEYGDRIRSIFALEYQDFYQQ